MAKKAKDLTSGDTATSTEVRSPTSTSTETSTEALTQGNVTVTGGAGDGSTSVTIEPAAVPAVPAATTAVATTPVASVASPTSAPGIAEAINQLRQGFATPFFFDATRDAHFKAALDALSAGKV